MKISRGWLALSLALALIAGLLSACDFQFPEELLPSRNAGTTPTATLAPTATAEPTVPATATPAGPQTLTLWLPPQFDPAAGTPAGNLLKTRLAEFTTRKPNVQIDVRIKDIEGPGGLLDMLGTASAAAHQALPDLVILPSEQLETAALQGWLYSFDNLSTQLDDSDWFSFAREMARVQKNTFGMPFAADALVQVYHPEAVSEPARDFAGILSGKLPFVFTAADPQATFAHALYLDAGGAVRDEQGKPALDALKLEEVLVFFQEATTAGVFPYWLTSLQADDQSWQAFQDGRSDQVVTWVSRYLSSGGEVDALAPVPTRNGAPISVGGGWAWALTSPEPSHHPASVQLAEFLTESDFLSGWTEALGFLPARPSALQSWEKARQAGELLPVAESLRLYPPQEILDSLGKALEKATVDVLKEQAGPKEAAQAAVENFK
jgi:ABC-type glycerol-3-phosphate transport system substrate-binding protein